MKYIRKAWRWLTSMRTALALLFLLALAAAFLLLDGRSFQQLSDQSWSIGKIVESAWMTASLATLGGAVGAGLEEDDITRAAAYTRESDEG